LQVSLDEVFQRAHHDF